MIVKKLLMLAGLLTLAATEFGYTSPQQAPRSISQNPFLEGGRPKGPDPTTMALGWKPCPESAEALAKEADLALSWLKGSGVYVTVYYKDKDGHGQSSCKVQIKDSKMFRIEYPMMTFEKIGTKGLETAVSKRTLVSDGKTSSLFVIGKGFTNVQPLSSFKMDSTSPLDKWPTVFPKLMFSPIRGGHPLGSLISSVRAAKTPMRIFVEERRYAYKGQIIHQKRMTIVKRDPNASPISIQVTIDASHNLPVTIQTAVGPSKSTVKLVTWEAVWAAVKPGGFDKQAFVIPPAALRKSK